MNYEEYRRLWDETKERKTPSDVPLHLDIDITDNCNRKCVMCHQWRRPGYTDHIMSEELLNDILSDAKESGVCSINIGAKTEPTMNQPIFNKTMMILKHQVFLDTFIHTNGSLLNEEMNQSILDAGIHHVLFSFGLLDNPSDINVSLRNMRRFKQLRDEKGSKTVVTACYIPSHRLIDSYVALLSIADTVIKQDFFDCNSIIKDFSGMSQYHYVCPDAWQRMYITSRGKMFGCCNFIDNAWHMGLGVFRGENSIRDAWGSSKAMIQRGKILGGLCLECERCMDSYYHFEEQKPMNHRLNEELCQKK